jgi:hypothetical protein
MKRTGLYLARKESLRPEVEIGATRMCGSMAWSEKAKSGSAPARRGTPAKWLNETSSSEMGNIRSIFSYRRSFYAELLIQSELTSTNWPTTDENGK